MKHLYLFGLFFSLPFFCFSQGEWNNWCFGLQAGVTFNYGAPVPLPLTAMVQGARTVGCSISDSVGNILFYSNGYYVYDRNNNMMPNGWGLLGGNGDSQSILAVQNIANKNQYYLFTVGHQEGSPPTQPIVGLHYSILDMQLNGGYGDIVTSQKNIPVPYGDSAVIQLSAIRHSNNKDVWVVVLNHGNKSNYQSYLINSSGLQSTPVSSMNNINAKIRSNHSSSNLKISPDGKNLICTDSLTQLCYFDPTSGKVTPRFTFKSGSYNVNYGKEFSIDSRCLYITQVSQGQGIYNLYQYNMGSLDSLAFVQSEVLIGQGAGNNIQLAPDWKIYLNNYNIWGYSLNVVNNPSIIGFGCNYQENSIELISGHNGCLPQFLQKYKVYVHDSGHCQYNPVYFYTDIYPPPDSLHWDFGDPTSGGLNSSNLPTPSHIYTNVDTYTVELLVRHIDKRYDTAWQTITILPSPQPNLGLDKTICQGDSTLLDAGACAGCTYSLGQSYFRVDEHCQYSILLCKNQCQFQGNGYQF